MDGLIHPKQYFTEQIGLNDRESDITNISRKCCIDFDFDYIDPKYSILPDDECLVRQHIEHILSRDAKEELSLEALVAIIETQPLITNFFQNEEVLLVLLAFFEKCDESVSLNVLKLLSCLTNLPQISQFLISNGLIPILCTILMQEIWNEELIIISLKCLHRIAASSRQCCFQIAEFTDPSPITSILHTIEIIDTNEFSVLPSCFQDSKSLKIQVLSLNFLVSLINCEGVPLQQYFDEIASCIINALYSIFDEIKCVALSGCEILLIGYYETFQSNCLTMSKFIELASQEKNEKLLSSLFSFMLTFVELHPKDIDILIQKGILEAIGYYQKDSSRLLSVNFLLTTVEQNPEFSMFLLQHEIIHQLYNYLDTGSYDVILSTLNFFGVIFNLLTLNEKMILLNTFPNLIFAYSSLFNELTSPKDTLSFIQIVSNIIEILIINENREYLSDLMNNEDFINSVPTLFENQSFEVTCEAKRLNSIINTYLTYRVS